MKKLLYCLMALMTVSFAVQAKKMSDLKIYINPGHGGYTGNDRPISLEIFASNDTNGYWESKSNLYKGLHFYHILDSLGTKAMMSRIKNTEADDRDLGEIGREATNYGADLFFSIHSNAGENTNFVLTLYHENKAGVPRYPENITLSNIHWNTFYTNKLPIWTRHTPYVCGDVSFYGWTNGLGVLSRLYTVGLLSEGSNHEHRPEAYRLLNDDYLWLEAWHFVKVIMEYYNTEDRFVTGNVAGIVYDHNNLREKDLKVPFTAHQRDKNATVNGAYIELLDMNGKLVQKRTTDNFYNGVFVFRNVTPGKYRLRASHANYHTEECEVTVTANEVTYNDIPMVMKRPGNLEITSFTPADGTSDVSCSARIDMDFNYDLDVAEFEKNFSISPEVKGSLRYSNSYRHVQFVPDISFDKLTTYTVTIGAGARSADKYNSDPTIGGEKKFVFSTKEYDKIEMLGTYPSDGGTVDYRKPYLEFRFDSKLYTTGLTSKIVVKDENGDVLAYNTRSNKYNTLSNGYGNAILALNKDLVPGKKYTVRIDEDVRNIEFLPYGYNTEIQFTAVDNGEPKEGTLIEGFERKDAAFDALPENCSGINGTVTYTRSTADKLFDTAGGKLNYNFSNFREGIAEWKYIPVEGAEKILVKNNKYICVHVSGDFNNHALYIAVSGGGDTKYFKVCDTDFKGWKYFDVPVSGLLDDVDYTFSGVRLEQAESPVAQIGNVVLDNIMIADTPQSVGEIGEDIDNGISIMTSEGMVTVSTDESHMATLYDMLGRVIARTTGSTIKAQPGQYVIKVVTEHNTVARRIML